jgi:hypothetical protein
VAERRKAQAFRGDVARGFFASSTSDFVDVTREEVMDQIAAINSIASRPDELSPEAASDIFNFIALTVTTAVERGAVDVSAEDLRVALEALQNALNTGPSSGRGRRRLKAELEKVVHLGRGATTTPASTASGGGGGGGSGVRAKMQARANGDDAAAAAAAPFLTETLAAVTAVAQLQVQAQSVLEGVSTTVEGDFRVSTAVLDTAYTPQLTLAAASTALDLVVGGSRTGSADFSANVAVAAGRGVEVSPIAATLTLVSPGVVEDGLQELQSGGLVTDVYRVQASALPTCRGVNTDNSDSPADAFKGPSVRVTLPYVRDPHLLDEDFTKTFIFNCPGQGRYSLKSEPFDPSGGDDTPIKATCLADYQGIIDVTITRTKRRETRCLSNFLASFHGKLAQGACRMTDFNGDNTTCDCDLCHSTSPHRTAGLASLHVDPMETEVAVYGTLRTSYARTESRGTTVPSGSPTREPRPDYDGEKHVALMRITQYLPCTDCTLARYRDNQNANDRVFLQAALSALTRYGACVPL